MLNLDQSGCPKFVAPAGDQDTIRAGGPGAVKPDRPTRSLGTPVIVSTLSKRVDERGDGLIPAPPAPGWAARPSPR